MKTKKVVIVTGGLGFLGSYLSYQLIKKKFKVIILDNKKIISLSEKKLIKKCFIYENLDIKDEKKIIKFFDKLLKKKIYPNYLINNATIDSVPKGIKKKYQLPSLDDWNNELAVSLTGSYLMIKFFGEQMVKKKFGKIINIGSDLSVIAPNQDLYSSYKNFIKPVTYSVIKHGMLGMTRYFASLYAAHNVQVNMLSPGPIFNHQKLSFVQKLLNFIPMKRMASREDLFKGLVFLMDDKNQYMTGQNIIIDGGRTII